MPRRSWGPFSGRQLTVIVLVALIVFGIPGTVLAVDTFSNVAVEDPVSGAKAAVDAKRHLEVSDGLGPVTVDGTVAARPAVPLRPWRASIDVAAGSLEALVGPTTSAIHLTSLSWSAFNAAAAGSDDIRLIAYTVPTGTTSCSGETYLTTIWHLPSVRADYVGDFDFATPLQIKPPSGKAVCLEVNVGESWGVTLNASGFLGG